MSCVQLSEGSFQAVSPLGLWSSLPELSKSYMAMASKLFTFTFTFTFTPTPTTPRRSPVRGLSTTVALPPIRSYYHFVYRR